MSFSAIATRLAGLAGLIVVAPAATARAAPDEVARFAVVVGFNDAPDSGLAPLKYADDDAALFAELFRAHSRRTRLLTILDDRTQRRFPGVAKLAEPPTLARLRETLASVYEEIGTLRRSSHVRTELVFVYVGHGGLDDTGRGYVHLSGGRLTRADLFHEVIAASPADRTHLILDTCHAFSLVAGRGEGAEDPIELNRAFERFLSGNDLEDYPSVGVLIASSASHETHEWSYLRAGLFSHQVRSALSGAADINRDFQVEYSEVAAFVAAANSELPPSAERLSVLAWPPRADRHSPLLTVPGHGHRRVLLGPDVVGRMHLERDDGVIWAELNKDEGGEVALFVPAKRGFFLRDAEHELEILPGDSTIGIAYNPSLPRSTAARGAAGNVLRRSLFAVPYGRGFYRGFVAAHRELYPVGGNTTPEIETSGPVSAVPVDVAAGYVVSRFPVARRFLEHGLFVRAELDVAPRVSLVFGAEVGRSRLEGLVADTGERAAATFGVAIRQHVLSTLRLQVAGEVAYEALRVGDEIHTVDPTALFARVRVVLQQRLAQRLWLEVSPSYAAHWVTIGRRNRWRDRPELSVGLSWRF